MKFTVKGYSAALARLAATPAQIAKPVAARIAQSIDRQFSAGTDPYGRPWAPLKPRTIAKGRFPPPLTDTGAGRASVRVTAARGAGITITIGKGYMGVHQDGDPPRMAARKILPEGRMPNEWRGIYQQELTKAVKAGLSGGK